MTSAKKYRRCMVLAGGGFRFGIYLGMVAAAREAGYAPDLLLATCGGAVAAVAIRAMPDDAQRKAWLGSPDMYRYWQQLKSSRQAGILRAFTNAARRKLSRGQAIVIPDLFSDYLFEAPPPLPLPPKQANDEEVAVAIIGGKLLFSEGEVGQARGSRKLFSEIVFCDSRTSALLDGMTSPLADPRWGDHAISEQMLRDTATPLHTAAGISIADMVYFPCVAHASAHYTGGMIDLFPIEVARRLSDQVMMEFKAPFDQAFSIPAWRTVLGLDGNLRLCHVNGQAVDVRVDTSDMFSALAKETIKKRLDWRNNRISLAAPPSYDTYVAHMEAQWNYGYERGLEACRRQGMNAQPAMRKVNRYNKGTA